MPQLHHRDPSIIGLLGASPHLSSPQSPTSSGFPAAVAGLQRVPSLVKRAAAQEGPKATSEAFDDVQTPPQTPVLRAQEGFELGLQKGKVADLAFERPFYELIVDGIHSHPNSVRVRLCLRMSSVWAGRRDVGRELTSLFGMNSLRTLRTPRAASSSPTVRIPQHQPNRPHPS